MALRICWGVKAKGSKRLRCSEPVDDPKVVEETMRLINEFLSRVERHGGVLLSDSATPFDNAINALGNWLPKIKAKIRESNDEGITNLRRAMLNIGKEMLRLLKRAREKWLKEYRKELEELINKLRSGKARVVISGEPFDKDKSFMVHLYTKNLTIEVARVAKTESITMWVSLTGLKGVHVVVPKLFGDGKLRAMQCGLLLTDGSIEYGYPIMTTSQLWQAIAWLIAWPGRNYICIDNLGLNDNDVGVTWHLRALDHRGVFKNKAEVAEVASRLDNEEFPTFTLYTVLGDGDVNIKWKWVRLTMGHSKLELWGGLIERLESMGFKRRDDGYRMAHTVKSSKAVELAKKMLGDSAIKTLVEDLVQLPDAEKPRRLVALAGMEPKPKGKSMVEVAGIRMTIGVDNNGYVVLKVRRKDYEDARAVLERLKGAGYEEVELSRQGDRCVVYMGMDVIRKHPELVTKVCEVLRRMHEEAINKGEERRARSIARAMKKLGCPAQSPRAQ